MNPDLEHELKMQETDLTGVLNRFSGNEALYLGCLNMFLEDRTMDELETALRTQSWDDAFTAAHALKGLAGNMGFIPLFHASAKLVMLIRVGRMREFDGAFTELKRCHDALTKAIRHYCAEDAKGE